MLPENVIYKSEELDKIYNDNKDYLKGINKATFHQALVASEAHFRHEVANSLHSRNLMKLVIEDLKEELNEVRTKQKELLAKNMELRTKHAELMKKLKEHKKVG